MVPYLVTVVSSIDVDKQPFRIQAVILHHNPVRAAEELMSTLPNVIISVLRSVSVEELHGDYSQLFPLPTKLL